MDFSSVSFIKLISFFTGSWSFIVCGKEPCGENTIIGDVNPAATNNAEQKKQ